MELRKETPGDGPNAVGEAGPLIAPGTKSAFRHQIARSTVSAMPGRKKYVPRCPSPACSGDGIEWNVSVEHSRVSREGLDRRHRGELICSCSYCGLVWFQKRSDQPGMNPVHAGFADKEGFKLVPLDYEIRAENKSSYWERKIEVRARRVKR